MASVGRRGWPTVVLLAALLAVLVVPLAGVQAQEPEPVVTRLAGDDRVATALAIARATVGPQPAPALVVAIADDFPDGLAGGPLASVLDAALVLTDPEDLSPAVAAALDDLVVPSGRVVVLGGPSAIGPRVASALADTGRRVTRVSGSTRAGTAVAVAEELLGVVDAPDHVFLAAGSTFADALAASAVAAARVEPVLLTTPTSLSPEVRAWLRERAPDRVTVVGGPNAVAEDVVDEVRAFGIDVERIAGETRYDTAAAIADRFAGTTGGGPVVVASGVGWPDALAGGPLAASVDAPVLLVGPELPDATDVRLRSRSPGDVLVLGGPAAVSEAVVRRASEAVTNGPVTPRLMVAEPGDGTVLTSIDAGLRLRFDRGIDTADVTVLLDGASRPMDATVDAGQVTVVLRDVTDDDLAGGPARTLQVAASVVAAGRTATVTTAHEVLVPDDVYAVASGIALREPSASVDMIGFHQANHDGARPQATTDNGTRTVVMSSRGRGTDLASAADIVVEPDVAIVAPVTGRIVRGGSYVLYCRYTDSFLVIEPDGFPGFEVKLLHFQGITVGAGDRVEAGETVIGSGPTQLPFRSQVDEHSSTGWPHVHLEVVDTSIPDRPNSGSGSDGC